MFFFSFFFLSNRRIWCFQTRNSLFQSGIYIHEYSLEIVLKRLWCGQEDQHCAMSMFHAHVSKTKTWTKFHKTVTLRSTFNKFLQPTRDMKFSSIQYSLCLPHSLSQGLKTTWTMFNDFIEQYKNLALPDQEPLFWSGIYASILWTSPNRL